MYIFEHVLTLCALEEILNKFKLVNTILVCFFKGNSLERKKKFKESIKYICKLLSTTVGKIFLQA